MGLKEIYQEKLETQLREWGAKINELRIKADELTADAKIRYREEIEALRAKYDSAQRKLSDLKEAGEGVWEELKGGIERAWEDLKEGVERAAGRIGSKEGGREREALGREEEIRRIARGIWEAEGRPDGRTLEHWRQAETIWEEQHAQKASAKPPETAAQRRSPRKRPQTTKRRGRRPKAK